MRQLSFQSPPGFVFFLRQPPYIALEGFSQRVPRPRTSRSCREPVRGRARRSKQHANERGNSDGRRSVPDTTGWKARRLFKHARGATKGIYIHLLRCDGLLRKNLQT